MASKTFIDFLVEEGLLSEKQNQEIKSEAKKKGKSINEILLEKNILPEKKIFEEKSKFLKIPLKIFEYEEKIPFDVLRIIPEEAAQTYKFIPLAKKNSFLEVGMVNPSDLQAQDALRFILFRKNLKSKIFLITLTDFQTLFKQYRSLRGEVSEALQKLAKELKEKKEIPEEEKIKKVEMRIEEEAPITKMVAVIFKHAVEGRASDIHIEPFETKTRVRFRVDGILYSSLFLPKEIHASVVSRIKILANLKIDETRIPQDGRIRLKIDERNIDFRVSTFPTSKGEKVVLRILDPTRGIKTLPELGLESKNLKIFKESITKPYGMILLTGPTGSGKSTTLYAILNILNKEKVNIVSLEDPVEYYIEGVNQSQVRPEIGYSFASGLRSILRQDPDIIMVGEIRDSETAELAIHAALTGHLVLSTLHTNDAIGVVPRLMDMGIEKFLIPASLILASAQRLVKKLCPYCRKPVELTTEAKEIVEKVIKEIPQEVLRNLKIKEPYKLYSAKGCKRCGFKGTKGRIAIFEAFKMSPEIEKIVLTEFSEEKLKEELKNQGMISMFSDGVLKALRGIVSLEEVLQIVKINEKS